MASDPGVPRSRLRELSCSISSDYFLPHKVMPRFSGPVHYILFVCPRESPRPVRSYLDPVSFIHSQPA